jgi:hypothetical protein
MGGERMAHSVFEGSIIVRDRAQYVPGLALHLRFTAGAVTAAWLFRSMPDPPASSRWLWAASAAGILALNGHDQLSRLFSAYHLVREI